MSPGGSKQVKQKSETSGRCWDGCLVDPDQGSISSSRTSGDETKRWQSHHTGDVFLSSQIPSGSLKRWTVLASNSMRSLTVLICGDVFCSHLALHLTSLPGRWRADSTQRNLSTKNGVRKKRKRRRRRDLHRRNAETCSKSRKERKETKPRQGHKEAALVFSPPPIVASFAKRPFGFTVAKATGGGDAGDRSRDVVAGTCWDPEVRGMQKIGDTCGDSMSQYLPVTGRVEENVTSCGEWPGSWPTIIIH